MARFSRTKEDGCLKVDDVQVGDRLDSIYGPEHRGTVVRITAAINGDPLYHVKRDSDGFVWIGWPLTIERLPKTASA